MLRLRIDRYVYTAPTGPAFCGLKVFDVGSSDTHAVVVFTERADNPGMSVTNFADGLATNIVADFGLNPDKTVFIEHWPERGEDSESFDMVRFTWRDGRATAPQWERWPAETIQIVTGVEL